MYNSAFSITITLAMLRLNQPIKKSPFHNKAIRSFISFLFYALIIAFLYFYLQGVDFSKLEDVKLSWMYLVAASIIGLVSRYFGTYIWFVLLNSLGAKGLKKNFSQLVYVYAKSWMGRYIPGTAPWILGKIYFASQHGVSKNKLAVSSLLEGGLKIVVTMAVASLLLLFDPRLDVIAPELKIAVLVILAACTVAVIPRVFNYMASFAYKLIRRQELPNRDLASNKTVIRGASLYAIGSIVGGLSFFLIAKSVYPELEYGDLLFIMAAGNLAAAVSMLAIFVPSGIGVRESVQLVLLSIIMPVEFALIITVVTRLWSVAVDFIFWGLSKLLVMFWRNNPDQSTYPSNDHGAEI